MKKKLWFKSKTYGYGWTPVAWQGWVITAVFTVLILAIAFRLDETASFQDVLLQVIIPIAILTAGVSFICYKTGEKPKWRWGRDDTEDTKQTFE